MQTLDLTIPEPFRGRLRVGTCSWKCDDWRGLVYREDALYGPFDYLPDYARFFSTVEVDQWFWGLFGDQVKLPEPDTARRYAESVPDDFLFSVKAPNALTLTHHYSRQTRSYAAFAGKPNPHFLSRDLLLRFLDALAPMKAKLGPIMFQFEYLNRDKMPSRKAFLDRLHEFLESAPREFCYAIETRNPKYLSDPYFAFLREHKVGCVFLEGYYMPPIGEVIHRFDTTNDTVVIIRLHGPDREGMEMLTHKQWDRIIMPKARSIRDAVEICRASLERGVFTIVNANNHLEGCAPLTAERFLKALREAT